MSRSTHYHVLCDIDNTTDAEMPSATELPTGWLSMAGSLFSAAGAGTNDVDACPACVAALAAVLPANWAAAMPTPPG